MAQNIYDNPDFFAGYSQLPRQVQRLDGAPEWPMLRAMLPEVAGRRVVDLGCGFGWVSRWLRGQGAASVLGLDLLEKMIARAKADWFANGVLKHHRTLATTANALIEAGSASTGSRISRRRRSRFVNSRNWPRNGSGRCS